MSDPIELEPSAGKTLAPDARRLMPEPPPVRVLAVADVHLPTATGVQNELDAFYVDLLGFERVTLADDVPTYRAENFALVFDVQEPPVNRDGLIATMIQVPSLSMLRTELDAREIPFESVRGLTPGHHHFMIKDPAGNWIAVSEWRVVG
jgi:hypothetical protein